MKTWQTTTFEVRTIARTAVWLLKVFPMLPSRPINWVTPNPVVERVRYLTSHGPAEGDLYRPSTAGPHPGLVVCLGVVPFGVDHPQVPRLGEALARAGFAVLLYWSPAMRDFRLDPADIDDIASVYEALLARPDIDPARSCLLARVAPVTPPYLARAQPGEVRCAQLPTGSHCRSSGAVHYEHTYFAARTVPKLNVVVPPS
jgi:hypothetical protein